MDKSRFTTLPGNVDVQEFAFQQGISDILIRLMENIHNQRGGIFSGCNW